MNTVIRAKTSKTFYNLCCKCKIINLYTPFCNRVRVTTVTYQRASKRMLQALLSVDKPVFQQSRYSTGSANNISTEWIQLYFYTCVVAVCSERHTRRQDKAVGKIG
jgi:hypothetical protein